MKKFNRRKTIVLITFGILFAFSIIITINLSFIMGNSSKSSNHSDNKKLRMSKISGKIHIDNNWTAAKSVGITTGNGTFSEPYVIEDLVIDAGGSETGILIENSDVYFRIENCTIYNSGNKSLHVTGFGIRLSYVSNSQLINNNCSSNYIGIHIGNCDNITISGNIVNDNYQGIWFCDDCDYNTISGNTVNNNEERGMHLHLNDYNSITGNKFNHNGECGLYLGISRYNNIMGNNLDSNAIGICLLLNSDYNIISGNNASYNEVYGIWLHFSNYNTISGNKLIGNNNKCWKEESCEGNLFENNECSGGNTSLITLFILIFSTIVLFSIISVVVILISKKLMVHKQLSTYSLINDVAKYR
ncbi:MAG: nitrous oxide reductase family maturation protein NosD [Promethearchaeota archaeon]